jgi:hypothetical protein
MKGKARRTAVEDGGLFFSTRLTVFAIRKGGRVEWELDPSA